MVQRQVEYNKAQSPRVVWYVGNSRQAGVCDSKQLCLRHDASPSRVCLCLPPRRSSRLRPSVGQHGPILVLSLTRARYSGEQVFAVCNPNICKPIFQCTGRLAETPCRRCSVIHQPPTNNHSNKPPSSAHPSHLHHRRLLHQEVSSGLSSLNRMRLSPPQEGCSET